MSEGPDMPRRILPYLARERTRILQGALFVEVLCYAVRFSLFQTPAPLPAYGFCVADGACFFALYLSQAWSSGRQAVVPHGPSPTGKEYASPSLATLKEGWLGLGASPRLKLTIAMLVWANAALLLSLGFTHLFSGLSPSPGRVTLVLLDYMLPLGIGFAAARQACYPLRTKAGPVAVSRPQDKIPSDMKRYAGEDLAPSGFPYDYQRYQPQKSSKDLQKEYLEKRSSGTAARFDSWSSRQFSFYNVLGVD